MNWIIPLVLLIVTEGVADILAKEWTLHGTGIRWAGAIAGYIVANSFWLFALRDGAGLARGSMIFSVASAILALFIGMVLYKETLTKMEVAGVLLGTVSLVLIFWNEV